MRASRPSKRGNMRWCKHPLDLAKAGSMLRDYAIGCDGDPETAFVWLDSRGQHRRIVATYAGGWRLQINFALNGAVSSYSHGIRLCVKGGAA